MTVIITILLYFSLLLIVGSLIGKGGNEAFFRGERSSSWPMVAIGMIGASISGITFISVPGMVLASDMTYLQMCLGFIPGYIIVAFVLLPIYYRYSLTSIYTYLERRFGRTAYRTGASFFLLSKFIGAAARLYIVCMVLQHLVFDRMGIPYAITAAGALCMIWLYTRKSGIKALVWTDVLQTVCMTATIIIIAIKAAGMLGLGAGEAVTAIASDSHSRIFEFSDLASRQHFAKQFLSGIFIVIVMTGLDQDMMQKNLTCKDLRSAQKNMCVSGLIFAPLNLLILSLGILMVMLYAKLGMELPEKGDDLLCGIIQDGQMGQLVLVTFTLGIISSAFSSADSALTALTTSFSIDILGIEDKDRPGFLAPFSNETVRKAVHIAVMALFLAMLVIFRSFASTSMIDAVYTIASYTYGPLLGLFIYGLFTKRAINGRYVPAIGILSPVICYFLAIWAKESLGYSFSYELLLVNAGLVMLGLWISGPAGGKKTLPDNSKN